MMLLMMMKMMKIMRTNKSIVFSSIFNKKATVVIPDKKGILGSGYFKRHHMIGYSIVSDNAHAPGPSKSIYISKTNQKPNILYIPNIKALQEQIFPYKSLVKKKVPTYTAYTRKRTFHHHDSHFTSLWGLFDGSKNQRNPIPKHVELQIISTYSNQ